MLHVAKFVWDRACCYFISVGVILTNDFNVILCTRISSWYKYFHFIFVEWFFIKVGGKLIHDVLPKVCVHVASQLLTKLALLNR